MSRVESKPSLFGAATKKVAKRFSLCKLHGRNTSQLGAVDPLSFFTTMKENCIMKVEFSYRNYALFSRYSQVKVHIANPDSNLAALNHAAE